MHHAPSWYFSGTFFVWIDPYFSNLEMFYADFDCRQSQLPPPTQRPFRVTLREHFWNICLGSVLPHQHHFRDFQLHLIFCSSLFISYSFPAPACHIR